MIKTTKRLQTWVAALVITLFSAADASAAVGTPTETQPMSTTTRMWTSPTLWLSSTS